MPAQLTEAQHGHWLLTLSGPLTIYEVAEVKTTLKALPPTPDQLSVHLADVDEIDTAGLQLLLVLQKWLGEQLHLIHHSEAVIELLDLFQLAPLFGDEIVLPQH